MGYKILDYKVGDKIRLTKEFKNDFKVFPKNDIVEITDVCEEGISFIDEHGNELIYVGWKGFELIKESKDFVKDILEDPKTFGGWKDIKYTQSNYDSLKKDIWYGAATDRTGMTVIHWCTEGHSCTYFGKDLPKNISVLIEKDGGTRVAFNGYCFTREDFIKILNLTW